MSSFVSGPDIITKLVDKTTAHDIEMTMTLKERAAYTP